MEVFNWIVETSISASIIALIIICIRKLAFKKLSPNIIYFMWFIVIIKLFMPNGPESNFSLYNLFHKNDSAIVLNTNNINNLTNVENTKGLADISGLRSANENYINADNSGSESNAKLILRNEYSQSSKNTKDKSNYLNIYYVLCCIWIIGMGFILLKSIKSYILLRNEIKGKELEYINVELILKESMKELSINNKVKIIVLDYFQSPTLFGVINPKIIIPKAVLEKASSKEIKYILLHELVHLKRKDNLVVWILLLAKIIYWFNPIILVAFSLMQRDCEIACDYKVLRKIDRVENKDYGMTILNVIKSLNAEKQYIGTTTLIGNKNEIKERINMISKNKKYGITTLIVGVILIGSLGVAGLSSKSSTKNNYTPDIASKSDDVYVKEDTNNYTNLGSVDSNIIVYSSHYKEDYSNGLTVNDGDKILASKLNDNGLEAMYLKNTKEVAYENKMLIDVHRPVKYANDIGKAKNIELVVSRSSSKYEENQLFADKLKNELEKQGIVASMTIYENGILSFNADLSANSILLEIGSGASNKEDLEFCMSKLSQAIKNID